MSLRLNMENLAFASYPSSARSSFSSASSIADPFTPTSDRLSPQRMDSFDMSGSFCSDLSFDNTPSSTASVAGYFSQMAPSAVGGFMMMDGASNFSGSQQFGSANLMSMPELASDSGYSPLSANSSFSFNSGLDSPCMPPTPSQSTFITRPDMSGFDGLLTESNFKYMSQHDFDAESPINIFGQPTPLESMSMKTDSSINSLDYLQTDSYVADVNRQLFQETRSRTAALQRAQQLGSSPRIKKESVESACASRKLIKAGPIKTIKSGSFRCEFAGCENQKYKRSEHLKRHYNNKHNPDKKMYGCEFCTHSADRNDNSMQHLKLHATPDDEKKMSNRRVKYVEAAVAVYREKMAHIRRNKKTVTRRGAAGIKA